MGQSVKTTTPTSYLCSGGTRTSSSTDASPGRASNGCPPEGGEKDLALEGCEVEEGGCAKGESPSGLLHATPTSACTTSTEETPAVASTKESSIILALSQNSITSSSTSGEGIYSSGWGNRPKKECDRKKKDSASASPTNRKAKILPGATPGARVIWGDAN